MICRYCEHEVYLAYIDKRGRPTYKTPEPVPSSDGFAYRAICPAQQHRDKDWHHRLARPKPEVR